MLRVLLSVWLLLLSIPSLCHGDATLPKADVKGSADHKLVGRFKGSFIVSASTKEFDEVTLPLSELKPMADKRDSHNNILFKPDQAKTLEGRRTRLVYLNPPGVSPLEVIRNYQADLEKKGGKVLYQCAKSECGGAENRSSSGGGGQMSLSMVLWPEENVKEAHFSNGSCAQTSRINDQRFAVVELADSSAYVAIHTYLVNDSNYCKIFNDMTVAVVEIIEVKKMEEKMVTVKAEEMAEAIAESGSVALYGIYFDFNKAEVKPESAQTLEQIAKLLRGDAGLKVLIVGHTDSVGGYGANMELSKRRAEAVVKALVAGYGLAENRMQPVGVSFASPVASNDNEEGRAKNRRVELVKYN